MTSPAIPTFVDPAFGELGPSVAEMAGRLIAVIPTHYDPNAAGFEPGSVKPSVTFDLYIIDGGEMQFGAAPKATPPRPYPTHRIVTPALFRNQVNSNDNLVRAMVPHVGSGRALIGRIQQSMIGSKGNKPWNLTALDANDPARSTVAQFFGALAAGQYQLPEPQPINVPAPAVPNYAQPQQGAPAYGGQSYAPAQQQPVQGYAQQAAPIYTQQPVQQPVQTVPAQPQYMTAQQSYAAAAPAQPQQQLPPGMTPEFWATLSPQQQAMLLAQAQQQQPAQPGNPF